jgi:hypothetical protein
MIRGTEPPRSGRLRRQHFVQSFSLSRRPATETLNPDTAGVDLTTHMQLFCAVARYHTSRTRIAVVGNGNTDVGSKTATRESGQPIIERLASGGFPDLRIDHSSRRLETAGRQKCGAMSEQSADSGRGNEQVPQKLVHLVGYRDPNAGPDPWIRPRPISAKR